MNKVKLFVLLVVGLFAADSATAQKTGYISVDNVVALMPEVSKIDSTLRRFEQDSLGIQFNYLVSEYQRKDSMVNTRDSVRLTAAVRAQIRQELEGIAYQIQNWQPYAQQILQGKQNEILEPLYRKAMNAINQVSKEMGYTYVYNKEALLVMPPADDLLPMVAKKLNLKMPPETPQARR